MRTQDVMVLIPWKLWQLLKPSGKSYRRDKKFRTISPNMISVIDISVTIMVMIMLVKINTGLKLGLVCYSHIWAWKSNLKKNDESKSHVFDKDVNINNSLFLILMITNLIKID